MNILFISPSYPTKENNFSGPFFKEQALALSTNHNVTLVSCEIDAKEFSIFPSYKKKTQKLNQLELNKTSVMLLCPVCFYLYCTDTWHSTFVTFVFLTYLISSLISHHTKRFSPPRHEVENS